MRQKSPQVVKHVVKCEKMGLFNPRSREEQARYICCENARFRSVFKILSLELSSAELRTLLSAILIAVFSIVNFKLHIHNFILHTTNFILHTTNFILHTTNFILHIPNSILTSALKRAIIVAYTTVANATIGGIYAKNNEKSE